MAQDYATLEDARSYGYQSTQDDDAILTPIITRASRLFDKACNLPAGYFDKYGSGSATARRFTGNGTNYLQVGPYLSTLTPTVALPTGWDTPTFLESNPFAHSQLATNNGEYFLLRTSGDDESRFEGLPTLDSDLGSNFALDLSSDLSRGWPDGIKVTVTAKWGWDAVPDDVAEAVLETAIAIWRGRDAAFARVVALGESQQIFGALPDRARMIADKYRMGRMVFA